MIKKISFNESKAFFNNNNFEEFLLYEFKSNEDLYGVFNHENLYAVIIKSKDFCYLFSDYSFFEADEIKAFIGLYDIKEIISNIKLDFLKEKSCYLMTTKIEKYNLESKYNFPLENNITKIKELYKTLKKSEFSISEFEEFYMSLFYKNKNGKLRLYGIFEEEKCISSAILFLLDKDFIKLTSVATHPDFRKRGYGQKIIYDIVCDSSLKGKTVFLFCENNNALKFYKKAGFIISKKLFLYKP